VLDRLDSLNQLIKQLQRVPFLATKNLYRVTSYFLMLDKKKTEEFCAALLRAKQLLVRCTTCNCWQEKDQTCLFCSSSKRQQDIVCIVETWHDVLAIERTRGYDGVYHVLGGSLSPLDGIGPEELAINMLLNRVREKKITEIILATNQNPEGEATSAYIAQKLANYDVIISCLARGLPVGSSIEQMDRVTVFKALSERRPF
jgi:recombination protein RecR